MSEKAQTQVLSPSNPWTASTMAATVKHLPARPATSSGLLWRRRNIHSNSSSNFHDSNFPVNRQALLTSRLCRQERLKSLNLRRSNTAMFPQVMPAQQPSLTSTANTASHTNTTHSASSGKKSGSACDSGGQSVADSPQSEDSVDCEVVLTEEELERRKNVEKCLTWVQSLPVKFSSMHIVQQTVFADDS